MDAEDHRILFARLPADWLDQKALDFPAIGAFVGHALHACQVETCPQLLVHVSEPPLALSVQVGSIEVVQMTEIASGVNHHARLFVDVKAARGAFTGSYRG